MIPANVLCSKVIASPFFLMSQKYYLVMPHFISEQKSTFYVQDFPNAFLENHLVPREMLPTGIRLSCWCLMEANLNQSYMEANLEQCLMGAEHKVFISPIVWLTSNSGTSYTLSCKI